MLQNYSKQDYLQRVPGNLITLLLDSVLLLLVREVFWGDFAFVCFKQTSCDFDLWNEALFSNTRYKSPGVCLKDGSSQLGV